MKRIIYISLITLLFTSCKEKYHVSGRVYNPVTNEGLSGVRVTFKKFGDIGVSTPSGYEEVASAFTDANGNYDLKSKKQASWVQIETSADLYELGSLQNGTYIANVTVNKKENMIVDWHALPYGKLKTNIYNISCEGTSDSITIDFEYRIDKNVITFGTTVKTGCYSMTGTPTSDVPMGYYDITWTVTKPSSGTNTFTGEVFVPENGIGEFTINY